MVHSNQVKDQRLEALLRLNEDRNLEYEADMTSLKAEIQVCLFSPVNHPRNGFYRRQGKETETG